MGGGKIWQGRTNRQNTGSNISTVTYAFSLSAVFSLLRPKSLCLWGYLQRQGFWRIYVCSCNRSKANKAEKSASLTQTQRRCTHIGLLFVFQRLKISLYQTTVLKNAWPCYRCSHSFRNELLVVSWLVVLHLILSPLHAPWRAQSQSPKLWKGITVNNVFCDTTK